MSNITIMQNMVILATVAPFFIVASIFSSEFIAITEIQNNPIGYESAKPGGLSHEFIEISNFGSDSLYLDSLFLFDGDESDSIISWEFPLEWCNSCITNAKAIGPGQIAVIFDRDYFGISEGLRYPINSHTVILSVDDTEVGNGLSEDEGIIIYKGSRKKIERLLAAAVDVDQDISLNNTQLKLNRPSKTQEGVSLFLENIFWDNAVYSNCRSGTSLGQYEKLQNKWLAEWKFGGLYNNSVGCSIALFPVGQSRQNQIEWNLTKVNGKNKFEVAKGISESKSGKHVVFVELACEPIIYEFAASDSVSKRVVELNISYVWAPSEAVKITEIFPKNSLLIPEWIELYNSSAMPLLLDGWILGVGEHKITLATGEYFIQPSQYVVLTKDSKAFSEAFPSVTNVIQIAPWYALSDTRDTIRLWDVIGAAQETVVYDYRWFDSWDKESLERISIDKDPRTPQAWAVAAKPSPAQASASVVWRGVTTPSMIISPIPFTPNADFKDDSLSIELAVEAGWKISLSIWGFNGRRYCVLGTTVSGTYKWDGKIDTNEVAPCGPFFVVAELIDSKGYKKIIRRRGILWR